MRHIHHLHKGQSLITLLFFIVISITVVSAAVIMIMINSKAASSVEQGVDAYYIAESGMENALLRLLRNPSYTGETLNVGAGTAVITVSGSTLTSTGRIGEHMKKIQVTTSYATGVLTITSWREIN